ncbi:MAG: outer membrane lipopolysaccharide assembly protein LptE/RlpB [Gammaproteobacteria bacterium]|jgi:outer membrane lipopolysaccharide assembly protein LptE/RlpB
MLREKNRLAALLIMAVSLSACGGWDLRGVRTQELGIKSVYLIAQTAPELQRWVAQELRYSGVMLGRKTDSQIVIELTDESFDRRVISVDPDNGKVREVELGLEVTMSVRSKDGKLLIAPEKRSWVQDYVFDETSLLGTTERAKIIERELAQDAAQTILLRLETLEIAPPAT